MSCTRFIVVQDYSLAQNFRQITMQLFRVKLVEPKCPLESRKSRTTTEIKNSLEITGYLVFSGCERQILKLRTFPKLKLHGM